MLAQAPERSEAAEQRSALSPDVVEMIRRQPLNNLRATPEGDVDDDEDDDE